MVKKKKKKQKADVVEKLKADEATEVRLLRLILPTLLNSYECNCS
jgi:hypothetical protein